MFFDLAVEIWQIPLDKIEVGKRLRDIEPAQVVALQQSFIQVRMRTPIPLDAFIALVYATAAKERLGFVPGMLNLIVIENEYADLIEDRLLEDYIEELVARRQVLSAKRKARR